MSDRRGRCPSCGVCYRWDQLGWSLAFAHCPKCGGELVDVPIITPIPIIDESPLGPILAAVLRQKRGEIHRN